MFGRLELMKRILEIFILMLLPNVVWALDDEEDDLLLEEATSGEVLSFEVIEIRPDSTLIKVLDRDPYAIKLPKIHSPRRILFRGFDTRYNTKYVDGSPIWNSNRIYRSSQLNIYPSGILNNIDVYRAITPDMEGNTVGGYASGRTFSAFDGGNHPYFNAKAQAGHYEQAGEPDDRINPYRFDAIGKFTFGHNNNWGGVFGVDVRQQEFFSNVSRVQEGYQLNSRGLNPLIDVPERQILYNATVYQTDREQQSFFAKLETRVQDKYYGFLSFNYFRQDDLVNRNRAGHFFDPANLVNFSKGQGTFTNSAALVSNINRNNDRDSYLGTLGFDFQLSEESSLILRAAYTRFNFNSKWDQTQDFINRNARGAEQHTYDVSGDSVKIGFPGADPYTDPRQYRTEDGRTFNQNDELKDDLFSFNADYINNFHPESKGFGYKTGISARRLDRDFNRSVIRFGLSGLDLATINIDASPIDSLTPTFINTNAYWSFISANATSVLRPEFDNFGADHTLTEDIYAGYGLFSYASGHYNVYGGLRVEHTRFDLANFSVMETALGSGVFNVNRTTHEGHYTEILPSFHVEFTPNDNLAFRLGYARSLARPDFADFANGSSVNKVSSTETEIRVSDPNIGPRLADNYDATMLYFFDGIEGYSSLGFFYKDFENEIFTEVAEVADPGNPRRTIRTETARNTSSASVFGIEMAHETTFLNFLPKPFSNLGLRVSYIYTQGQWDANFSDGSSRKVNGLRNQPDHSAKATLSYRKRGKYSVHLSYSYRGRSFTGDFGTAAEDEVFRVGRSQVDINSWYRVHKNITAHFFAQNITGSGNYQESGSGNDLVYRTIDSEPSYWLGVKYKY